MEEVEISKLSLDELENASGGTINRNGPYIRYKIVRGDTLSHIANKYHTTVAILCQINNIADPHWIYAGHYLLIPTKP